MKAALVAGGRVEASFLLEYMERENYEVTVAVDHGLEFFYENHLTPDYVVGDFDSVQKPVLEYFQRIRGQKNESEEERKAKENQGQRRAQNKGTRPYVTALNPVKDDTDTEHAIRMLLDMGYKTVHMFGCTGSRLDHVLGNIQLLGYGLRAGAECEILDSHNRIRLIWKETRICRREQFGTYVSLIPYTPKVTGLTLEGFAYPLKEHTMSCFYREDAAPISGISNEITSEWARISWKEGILVLVESRD